MCRSGLIACIGPVTARTMLRFARLLPVVLAGIWLGVLACPPAHAAEPTHVLIIYSFGREIAPYDTIASTFRTELAQRSAAPIVLSEATLDAGRPVTQEEEEAFLRYLAARFGATPPHLVVTIGPPAARLYLAHRDRLFPSIPLVMAALDQRLAGGAPLRATDAAVLGKVDLPALIDNIFRLLPDTTTIAVVTGASKLEEFWTAELQKEAAPFKDRARFEWLNHLSLKQMKERVAHLPPHSVVLYALMFVDAAGVPHERQEALTELYAASGAPIFGIYENELGRGIVGGPYTSQRAVGEQIAAAALSVMTGTPAAEPRVYVHGFEPPVYDWRQLHRWGIDTARLPPGSEIRFKPPTLWEEHRLTIVATVTVIVLQSVLIAALLWQRLLRRRAEGEARSLGGRLITAHEDERRRLARELHDDFTQRLAALAIQTARLEGSSGDAAGRQTARAVHDHLVELSEDVHALSYRLHPTVIEDIGLAEALRAECDRVARNESIRIDFDAGTVPAKLPTDAAVGLFRVAQEALRNVARHSKAGSVRVALHGGDGRLVLAVRDDGAGFDPASREHGARLGLASMRERMRLLGGALSIESAPGRGTTITAWLPVPRDA